MGHVHVSTSATWTVTAHSGRECEARGRMPRLPVILVWKFVFKEGRLFWNIGIECERDVRLDVIELQLLLRTSYVDWLYGDLCGSFPEIEPGDTTWDLLVAPDMSSEQAVALPEKNSELHPVSVKLTEMHRGRFRLLCMNSDYDLNSRIFQASTRYPEKESLFEAGNHELLSLEIDAVSTFGEIEGQIRSRRTIDSGKMSARFEHGCIVVSYDGIEVTKLPHLYSSTLVAHLWNDSSSLRWGRIDRSDSRFIVRGQSRRFSYYQDWELESVDGGILLRIWLEVPEPMDIQEYQVAIALDPAYSEWETDHEKGGFPPFSRGDTTWRHINRSYERGFYASALSLDRPRVRISVSGADIPFRMTVINTGYDQNARVLQALRTPDFGPLHFEKGRKAG